MEETNRLNETVGTGRIVTIPMFQCTTVTVKLATAMRTKTLEQLKHAEACRLAARQQL
jgi:hypothetical protein